METKQILDRLKNLGDDADLDGDPKKLSAAISELNLNLDDAQIAEHVRRLLHGAARTARSGTDGGEAS